MTPEWSGRCKIIYDGEAMKQHMKPILIGGMMLWLLLFSMDSMFGITWPNYTIERAFIWFPTVLLAVYWLLFGGDKKNKVK